MYYTYLKPYLRALDLVFYAGHTNDPLRRDREHEWENRAWVGSTIVVGTFPTRRDAMRAERELKRKPHREKALLYRCPCCLYIPEPSRFIGDPSLTPMGRSESNPRTSTDP
jgi:predicted GIY-YIG superfamily endonuclease